MPASPQPPPHPGYALRPPPPHIPGSQLRPANAWFWIAGVIGAIAVIVSIVLVVGFAGSLVDDLNGPLTPLNAPGETTIELEAGAERTIYRELGPRSGSARIPGAVEPDCSVTRAGGGAIELTNAFDWTLTRDGRRYRALYDFDATESGTYRATCRAGGGAGATIGLVIGEQLSILGILGRAGAALAVFFGGLGIAIAIAIVVAVQRDSHKRRLQHEAMQSAAAAR